MAFVGRFVLMALFALAVYLPLRFWHMGQGARRWWALLPLVPLFGLLGYVIDNAMAEVAVDLEPEILVLGVLVSLILSGIVGFLFSRRSA